MGLDQTPIPTDELEVFKRLDDVRVVIDVGARTDIDYLELHPNAEYHLFEPHPVFFAELKKKVGDRSNVKVVNCALGEYGTMASYNEDTQSIDGSNSWSGTSDLKVQVIPLDEYARRNNIQRVDFLKSDTEGNELKVFLGGWETLKLCRYIQYETWNDPNNTFIERALSPEFDIYDIGYRNNFCVRKGAKKPWLPTHHL